ncbi:MAG: DUF2461 family protein [Bacteroidetes bacterium]|nr:DUF2461 family protein [Bacteroidota bacterium]
MKSSNLPFTGFPKELFKFLSDLEKNNNTEWFNKNKDRYQTHLVTPSRSFVSDISGFFNLLNPAIRTEPTFNKTLMRISKDMRFTKGDPYRNYFLIHFGRFKMDSEFFVYLSKNIVEYGLFINANKGDNLFFEENINSYEKDIKNVIVKYKINKNFALSEIKKKTERLIDIFDVKKHFHYLKELKMFIFTKRIDRFDKLVQSPDFITEVVKSFSKLYPLYSFCISPQPHKILSDFSDKLGLPH